MRPPLLFGGFLLPLLGVLPLAVLAKSFRGRGALAQDWNSLEYNDIFFISPFVVVYAGWLFFLIYVKCQSRSESTTTANGVVVATEADEAGNTRLKCGLCKTWVYKRNLRMHREDCARTNSRQLEEMERPIQALVCPDCCQPLALWPATTGPKSFLCNNNMAASGSAGCWALPGERVRNNGDNWFNCFQCDYGVCVECAEWSLGLGYLNANPEVNQF